MEKAFEYIQNSIKLAKIFENTIDRYIVSEVFQSRIKLFSGDIDEAYSLISDTLNTNKAVNFYKELKKLKEMKILILLNQNKNR